MRKRYGRDYRVLARQSATAALDELRRLKADGPAGRPHPRRPDDAGDGRHRLPRRGARDRPGRQARDARLVGRPQLAAGDPDRLRRGPDRVLRHQAVAHGAGRALPPRGGRLPVRVVPPAASRVRGRAHRRRALGAALARAPRPARRGTASRTGSTTPTPTRAGRSCGTPASDEAPRLPVAVVFGGRILEDPSNREVAESLGVRSRPSADECDLLIVGAGPAGLAAGRVRLVGGPQHGGARARGPRRPGRAEHHDPQLPRLPRRHLRRRAHLPRLRAGVAVRGRVPVLQRGRVAASGRRALRRGSLRRRVAAGSRRDPRHGRRPTGGWPCRGSTRSAAPACSTGRCRPRRGRWWTWRSSCVGGGNSAGQAAIHLAKYARHVTLVTRGDGLSDSMSRYLVSFLENADRIVHAPADHRGERGRRHAPAAADAGAGRQRRPRGACRPTRCS